VVHFPSASRTDGPPLQKRDGPRISYVFFISDMPTFYIRKKSAPNDSSDTDNNEEAADYENECVGCKEDYRKTKKTEDWIKCTICGRWMHEGCTTYTDLCQQCGKHGRKKKYWL
jgi:hypothetical protein